tara:strand:+ start:22878 stop:23030 length:153 start_codon:yes stop_codon:yes gene_type:complete
MRQTTLDFCAVDVRIDKIYSKLSLLNGNKLRRKKKFYCKIEKTFYKITPI